MSREKSGEKMMKHLAHEGDGARKTNCGTRTHHRSRLSSHRRPRNAHPSFDQTQHDSAESVVPRVCHHAGPQALAPLSEQSKHHAEHGDQHHATWTFVTVRYAEHNAREQNSKV